MEVAIEQLGFVLANPKKIRSRAKYNKYEIEYETLFEKNSNLKTHLEVEVYLLSSSFPTQKRNVRNLVTDYLREVNREDLIMEYQLEEFEICTQTLERTLIDKVFAICDYYESDKLIRNSRHIYDIYKIWNEIIVSGTFDKSKFLELFAEVAECRSTNLEVNISAQNGYKLYRKLQTIIDEKVYEEDYQEITSALFHSGGEVDYEIAINSLTELIDYCIVPEVVLFPVHSSEALSHNEHEYILIK